MLAVDKILSPKKLEFPEELEERKMPAAKPKVNKKSTVDSLLGALGFNSVSKQLASLG
jgi:hypothetical protein